MLLKMGIKNTASEQYVRLQRLPEDDTIIFALILSKIFGFSTSDRPVLVAPGGFLL